MKSYHELKKIFKRLSHLSYVQRIMMWDEAVMMPEGAGEARGHALATLNRITQKMLINKKIKSLLEQAREESTLSPWDSTNLDWMEKKYINAACIPLKLTEEFTRESMACEQAWRKLRAQNNWREFLPYFERSFKLVKEMAERRSQVLHLSPYDALIDEYAPGFNKKSLDALFSGLKITIPVLLEEIIEKQRNENIVIPQGPFPVEQQRMLGLEIMKALQFDFQHGRLDVSHHPFCGGDSEDVRITTRYSQDEFVSAIMGICHETGHGLYEQGLPRKWLSQPVGKVDSMAMHESQSLLIEMEVCRSPEFFTFLLPYIEQKFGKQPAFTAQNLYKLVTKVEPSFIRVEADEVTYPLHIILRYEIEKHLFSGDLSLSDLPGYWNELMLKYLGISTKGNDKDGVMQDVHWPSGAFGYFPAYTLGRLIAAQLFARFTRAHPEFDEDVQQGDFQSLKRWLKQNVYNHASSLTTNDLLLKVTGEALNPQHFVNNIKKRYL